MHRHAPSARSTTIAITVGHGRCHVRVENDAPAMPPGGGGTGMGLIGLQQRASLLGGTCHGAPRGDGGFLLTLDVPLLPPSHTSEQGRPVGGGPHDDEPPPPPEIMTRSRLLGVVTVATLIVVLVFVVLVAFAPEALA